MEDQISQQVEIVFIKKDREQEYDEKNAIQWKNARTNLYRNPLPNELNDDYSRKYISQLFMNYQSQFVQDIRKELKKYNKQMESLKQSLEKLESQFAQKARELIPLMLIMKKGITSLKVLHIQYSPKVTIHAIECRYSISAYEFFKVVHLNELLNQVTIKGVQLTQFEQFMAKKHYLDNKFQTEHSQQDLSWIREFNPSKSLKLALSIQIYFDIKNDKTKIHLNHLVHFGHLFFSLSNIGVKIRLGQQDKIKKWANSLKNIYSSIKILKNVDLTICGQQLHPFIHSYTIQFVRSVLFGGLASLTNIAHISFQHIRFSSLIYKSIIYVLAVDQSLKVFFESNTITHLSLNDCCHFPTLPIVLTLQSLSLDNWTVRKENCFLSETLINNESIKFFKCSNFLQRLTIDDCFFNQLQNLIICNCKINLDRFTLSPSNIKYLSLQRTNLGNDEELLKISPKLYCLTDLLLTNTKVSYQFFSLIPSTSLENIVLIGNSYLIDRGLQQIDLKWPLLRYLTVRYCERITENVWGICKFKGLIQLCIDSQMLRKGKKYLYEHRSNGVRIMTY